MTAQKNRPSEGLKTVSFDYIKSNLYRVIHADGAVGGPTPTGTIHLNFWSQRYPIPKKVVHGVRDGVLGSELEREQRDAIIREVETGVVMSVETAIAVRDWLTTQIEKVSRAEQGEAAPQ